MPKKEEGASGMRRKRWDISQTWPWGIFNFYCLFLSRVTDSRRPRWCGFMAFRRCVGKMGQQFSIFSSNFFFVLYLRFKCWITSTFHLKKKVVKKENQTLRRFEPLTSELADKCYNN
jgi:hypothetical protein